MPSTTEREWLLQWRDEYERLCVAMAAAKGTDREAEVKAICRRHWDEYLNNGGMDYDSENENEW